MGTCANCRHNAVPTLGPAELFQIRRGYQAMDDRGELAADADPGRLAIATLAALQGGLLLAQIRRSTEPLEAALDTMLAHIASLMAA